jgi:hypothetical protein
MAAVLIVVGAFTAITIVILVIGLGRRLASLDASVTKLQRELLPMLEELQERSLETQRRAAKVQERAAALSPSEG